MKYDKIIRDARTGVYAAPQLLGPLRAAARRTGVAWLDLDLAGVHDRDTFLRRCAEVFALPDYFGGNWDALQECMLDLAASGVPGCVVHWRHGQELARRAPEAAASGLEIFGETAMYWSGSGRVFLVVVDRASAPGIDLQPLR
jgi:RNAse (barnase) inhibitor barstar